MPSILVVDDHLLILKSVESFVVRAGYDVTLAADGKEAIEMLSRLRFDVVITDIFMPQVNGLEVVRFIRSNPELDKTGIIVLSSTFSEKAVTEALAAGADEFFPKPVKPFELERTIKSVLAEKNRRELGR